MGDANGYGSNQPDSDRAQNSPGFYHSPEFKRGVDLLNASFLSEWMRPWIMV
ncbi:MAG: hypothetical protein ACR2G4_08710 [Pyrinomonadaceae bacterium]